MNKTELATKVAQNTETAGAKALAIINATFEAIAESMIDGEPVVIANFGKFVPFQSKARIGHNPKTGDPIDIAAKTTVKFKPGKGLKEVVNQ